MIFLLSLFCLVFSAHNARAQISFTESGPSVVKPGNTLELTCTVTGLSITDSSKIHSVDWVRQIPGKGLIWLGRIVFNGDLYYAESLKGRITILRDTSQGKVYLKLTNVNPDDSAKYYCTRAGGGIAYFDLWGPGTTTTVSAEEKRAPTVFPLSPCFGSLSSSQYVTIGCLSTSYFPPPVDVTWNSGSITSGITNFPDVRRKSGTYISTSLLTVSAADYKDKKYTCNVSHKATGQKINTDIDVVKPEPKPPIVEIAQASCGETGSVDLFCLISGYSPDNIEIQWLLNGERTSISPTNSTPYKDSEGNIGMRSKVSVPKADWNSGDSYTCRVNHPPSSTKRDGKISKCPDSGSMSHPKVIVLPPTPKDLLVTKQPKVTCEVSKLDSTESLRITWNRSDGKRGLPFQSDPTVDFDGKWSVKSTLKINIADWDSEKKFTCIVHHNDLPSPIEKSIQKRNDPTTEPTISVFPPTKEELSLYDFVCVVCLMKDFSHKDLYVQWKKNGQVIEEEYYLNTVPIIDEESESYLMFSRLIIEKSDWLRGSTYTCSGVLSTITSKEIKIEKCRGK